MLILYFFIFVSFGNILKTNLSKVDDNLRQILAIRTRSSQQYEEAVHNLINRIVPDSDDLFKIKINEDFNQNDHLIDTFELTMTEDNRTLLITANTGTAAAWGFNYYLKYYCNSSVNWSGKNININIKDKLPVVLEKVRISSTDYIRFYQNVCTYSYSYVWWDWKRWEYEIDWTALNGINLVYAQTAAEYSLMNVFLDLGFSRKQTNEFFTGPAYLAWFRMGNLKGFGGHLNDNWHTDQVNLLRKILRRYDDLGIKYVLPAFAGFVPDQIIDLYPLNKFTQSTEWLNFGCNYSCVLMVDPMDDLFQKIGSAYVKEVIKNFGTNHFYSADVFNEMIPKTDNLTYLANVNAAVFNSISSVDPKATWVMQSWAFNKDFWTNQNVKAFLSKIPKGNLLILDLYAEEMPHYKRYESFYQHYFIWNMLHDFGGANGIFGMLNNINSGPEEARNFPNSTMVGIGITMEGINQNEFVYEFMLEKAWRSTLTDDEVNNFARDFALRRYFNSNVSFSSAKFEKAWTLIVRTLYNIDDYQNKQLFTKRPSLFLQPEKVDDMEEFFDAWDLFVKYSNKFKHDSLNLIKYDLVDISKEALRIIFNQNYLILTQAFSQNDSGLFNKQALIIEEILIDMDDLLATDSRFLLGNWLEQAKMKATNVEEKSLYEWNARNQITLWGLNTTEIVFDYACKAWSGLIKDYYLPRWAFFLKFAELSLRQGQPLNITTLNEQLLINIELPFINSIKAYPTKEIGDSYSKAKQLNKKYRY